VKRLLLLRHAKAVPAETGVADITRPLAERGERDALRMGERLRLRHACPDLVVTSPAKRTLRTAEVVADIWGYPRERIEREQRLYLADPAEILAVIGAQDRNAASLLVVGHNPALTDLTHQLSPQFDLDDLPTGGVVALDADIEDWAKLSGAKLVLAYWDFPKNPSPPTAR
jgi:phosphohistidine phosphatase